MEQTEDLLAKDGRASRPQKLNAAWLGRLNTKERKELSRARTRSFLVYRDSQPELARVWWRWCEVTRQPHVAIKTFRRYAWVMLDMPTGVELTPRALEAARKAVEDHTPYGGWGSAPHAIAHPKVPRERAESLAWQLWDIARDSQRR